MNKHTSLAAAVFVAVLSLPLLASAQDRDQTRDQTRDQLRDTTQSNVYGWQLMTRQERAEYRARMRSLRTAQERERFRREHHERMQERAVKSFACGSLRFRGEIHFSIRRRTRNSRVLSKENRRRAWYRKSSSTLPS